MNAIAQLFALAQFLLTLAGCSPGATEFSNKILSNQGATLYSTATVTEGEAKFVCRESTSGQCHYTLYASACTDAEACTEKPLQTFVLQRGESKALRGIAKFHPCVALDAKPVGPDCQAVKH